MPKVQGTTILIDHPTTSLRAFRLTDTRRAPGVVLFIDGGRGQLVRFQPDGKAPTHVKSANMEIEIELIGLDEIHAHLHPDDHDHS
ncbi:MAG: hypothetical protein ACOX5Z_08750 [Desulfobulbus sp.]|jgi:hypothetical protein